MSQDQNSLPDPLQTPELPADTLTPEEHANALPMVQESQGDKESPVTQEEAQNQKSEDADNGDVNNQGNP